MEKITSPKDNLFAPLTHPKKLAIFMASQMDLELEK